MVDHRAGGRRVHPHRRVAGLGRGGDGCRVTPSVIELGSTSAVVTHGPRTSRRVALTFDDGWSSSRWASIARTLRRLDADGIAWQIRTSELIHERVLDRSMVQILRPP
jgi:hypothetical protein